MRTSAGTPGGRRFRYLFGWSLLLVGWSCGLPSAPAAESNRGDELAETRRWVAAKLQGQSKWELPGSGLTVVANYGTVQKNGRGDGPLRIDDETFERGFYCHAASKILVRLPSPGKTFLARVGVDSNSNTQPGRGSVVFSLSIDDAQQYCSEKITEGMAAVPVTVNLDGVTEFVLAVSDSGDQISCDQADWADAKVVLANGKTIWLDELPMVNVQRGNHSNEPPFSFNYGGRPSAEFLPGWKIKRSSRKIDDQRTEHVVTYAEPSPGLVIRCVATEYHDFPTVEWTLYFKNAGNTDTPIVQNIQALDLRLQRPPGNEYVLHHNRGDSCTPDSFEPLTTELGPGAEEKFAPAGGRSTNGQWPYYHVRWGKVGLIAVVAWPGQWAASFARDQQDSLRIQAGQELTHFTLHAGEEIRTPLVVLQFCRGERLEAQNLWRRWMLSHNVPRTNGAVPDPMFTSCSGGFFPGLKCNEKDELRFIDTFASHGVKLDYWWMDAGWYPCDAWPVVGTWEVDRTRFPRGLRAISDHAHSKGSKLILWFEPERVAPGTWLYEQRSDWLLGNDGGQKLLNLGNSEARAWLVDHIDKLIVEQGIDLYRQDFNMAPLGSWRAADAEDRQGLTEIRHVEGYLAYWDELRRRHPGMLIDSCASGGRRNDLETMRRAVPLLRSDYQSFNGDPSFAPGNQCHTYGLAAWLPYFGTGTYYTKQSPLYAARSYFCPAFGFCADVRRNDIDWEIYRRLEDDWRSVAPYMLGDFYPLTPYSLDEGVWIAWQFHRVDLDGGVVQVFRRKESIYESARLRLHGLEPKGRYELDDIDTPGTSEMTGHDLAKIGLPVANEDRPSATIIRYRRVD